MKTNYKVNREAAGVAGGGTLSFSGGFSSSSLSLPPTVNHFNSNGSNSGMASMDSAPAVNNNNNNNSSSSSSSSMAKKFGKVVRKIIIVFWHCEVSVGKTLCTSFQTAN
jgi:hypothetical protein